jgi:NitT/TauT family transport system permease protein
MSNAELAVKIDGSPQYRDWLRRERQNRLTVRAVQLALLLVFLVLWEVLPRAQLINPLFTSYPSAIWPTFLELLHGTPQQAGILTHTASTVFATCVGFTLATGIGTAIAAALWWWAGLYKVLDPYLVVAHAKPKTAILPLL